MKLSMPRFVLLFALAFTNIAFAKPPYEVKDIVLLQPDYVLRERIPAASLAVFIHSLNETAAEVLAGRDDKPAGGFLVVAIRPGKQSAVWIDAAPVLPTDLADALVARLRAIPPPIVEGGPVVFAVRVGLWGGTPPTKNIPSPEAWEREAKKVGRPLEIGELIERVWPR